MLKSEIKKIIIAKQKKRPEFAQLTRKNLLSKLQYRDNYKNNNLKPLYVVRPVFNDEYKTFKEQNNNKNWLFIKRIQHCH